MRVASGTAVNGLPFSVSPETLLDHIGEPDTIRVNHDGEVEYLVLLPTGDAVIYRCFHQRFVECTFPDRGAFIVDGVAVLSMRAWLASQPDAVEMARFCISRRRSMAYDYRNPERGSITMFRTGHWDVLLRQVGGGG